MPVTDHHITMFAIRRKQSLFGIIPALLLAIVLCVTPFVRAGFSSVLLPALACALLCAMFFISLIARNQGSFPYFELGAVYCAVVFLYTFYPLMSFLAREAIGIESYDARFLDSPITSDEVATIAWYQVLFLGAFSMFYLIARGRTRSEMRFPAISTSRAQVIVCYAVAVQAAFLLLTWLWQLKGETYTESYARMANLPTLQRQIAGHLQGEVLTVDLFVLIVLFRNYQRWKLLIYCILGFTLVTSFLSMGSRTEMAVMLLASLILFHQRVRPIREVTAALAACGLLILLLIYGIVRNETGLSLRETTALLPTTAGEFETVLSTAVDVERKQEGGLVPDLPVGPVTRYLAGLLAIIPQNVAPYEKFDHANWYMQTFYGAAYAEGAGMAFGVIAESIVGYGWYEVVCRGIFLGLAFGLIHRWLIARRESFWMYTFYFWLLLFCYQTFRDNTLALIYLGFHRFLIPAAIIWIGERLIGQRTGSSMRSSPALNLPPAAVARQF